MALHHYDLIVIGSGPAGEKGAAYAAGLGKRVALIEKEAVFGGSVANLGTLPSKTMRETALCLSGYKQRGIHGLTLTVQERLSAQDFLYRERLVRQLEQARIRSYLEGLRVQLVHGQASFIDGHTLRVRSAMDTGREEFYTANTVLIASGSSPWRPALWPVSHPALFDSESLLSLRELPQQLVVVGGGVIGCEYACIFASLGLQVVLIDEDERVLPFLDQQVSAALLAAMRAQGVEVRLSDAVVGIRQGVSLGLALKSGTALLAQAVLLATGRKGNTASLDLAAVGLSSDERGFLKVNEHYQTEQPHIYAAGDVIGFPGLASSAREQAVEAMIHAFTPEKDPEVAPLQPYGIYTIPECSMVGATEEDLIRRGLPWVAGLAHYAANARGQIIGARTGFLKLLFHRETMQLLGVHLIGEQATELVHIGLLALQAKLPAQVLIELCYNYPTLGELYKSASLDALAKRNAPAAAGGAGSLLKPRN